MKKVWIQALTLLWGTYPHLIDVGIMGHCIHGKTGLCAKAGIGCYQSGMLVEKPNMTVDDLKAKGITPVYLVTDHTGFYERYGWQFLCMVQGDGEPEMTRMYIHR